MRIQEPQPEDSDDISPGICYLLAFVVIVMCYMGSCEGRLDAAGRADLHQLVKAIRQVESSGNDQAVGDGGKAVGALQIHPIMVAEVNRILGEQLYTLDDRKDAGKSIEMFMVFSKYYAKHWNDWSAEGIARRWNGGARGHLKKSTMPYWRKVKKHHAREDLSSMRPMHGGISRAA